MRKLRFLPFLSLTLVLLSAACRQESTAPVEESARQAMADSMAPGAPSDGRARAAAENEAGALSDDGQAEKQTNRAAGRLEGPGLTPFEAAADRTLEYSISLNYLASDFASARRSVFGVARKYGYVAASESSVGDGSQMSATLRIRVKDIFAAIEELDAIGDLTAESIQTTDHTGELIRQALIQRRELARTQRRTQGPVTARSWAEREELVSASENAGDQAWFEQWNIRDRSAWATVQVSVRGPEAVQRIKPPLYRNALIGLANFFLWALYYAIYLSPFALLFLLLWRLRNKISALFRGAGWN